jgi:hypothetical protein
MLFSTLQTIELVAPVVHMSVFTSNTKKKTSIALKEFEQFICEGITKHSLCTKGKGYSCTLLFKEITKHSLCTKRLFLHSTF